MTLLQKARPSVARLATLPKWSLRNLILVALATLGATAPSVASAAEGDSVVLHIVGRDAITLWVAFALGLIGFLYGFYLRSGVLKADPGSERMREVGKAIHDGALAYLSQQIKTMLAFVVVIAIGLGVLFADAGAPVALGVAFCFFLGVMGSYFSGYTGMLMAVASNMRVAHAAIKSPRQSLEIAFRSGGVAGLITVGVALMGATLILLFGGEHATTLLVGFGFGGSLAALFMRVGGGIFTKAADVGADLVGKVEAGIPEDDPRNPAVIADNVGDNVGDCAGMVADVFESYGVTMVSAIVLGAASSIIFDQSTWTRLVVFALLAGGLGLAASLVGINLVRGSEDVDSDPLKAITRGFWISAGLAAVLTMGAAYLVMGGHDNAISTTQLMSGKGAVVREIRAVEEIRDSLATKGKVDPKTINSDEVLATEEAKVLGLTSSDAQFITSALRADTSDLKDPAPLTGYEPVTGPDDPRASKISTVDLTDPTARQPGADLFKSVATVFTGSPADPIIVRRYRIQGDSPGGPAQRGQPPMPPRHIDVTYSFGPALESVVKKQYDAFISQQKAGLPNLSGNQLSQYAAHLYVNSEGKPLLVVDGGGELPHDIYGNYSRQPQGYYALDAASLNKIAKNQATPGTPFPERQQIDVAFASHQSVPWWAFFLPILFGIIMSLALEKLTDYYVSTHRKPTQEVAGVSNAGPAPMIIQGFAYGAESAVFMTVALVIALMFPLFIFSPAKYGSYILSFYGIALVGIGLLTSTGYVLAMDTFGPISDNAQGVFEMSGEAEVHENGAKVLQRLDAAGNTTKALTKGFAIATAVIAAAALFHSYVDTAHLSSIGLRLDVPEIFLGLLLGGAAPYLFSAFTINAVGRSAFELIHEVRRQFREDSGIMAGTSKPDYARCVAIVTAAAQKELLGPGILAIALPVAVAFGFSIGKTPTLIDGKAYNLTGAEALGGFLAGAIVSGQLMAVLLSNAGGMWDNAKKLVEDGLYGGKGSEAHKASVVCDTVGDPFKDTAGPALNPLIKVMNLVGLLLAGIIVRPYSDGVLWIVTIIALGALAFSIVLSKKGSMSEEMQKAAGAAHAVGEHIPGHPESSSEIETPTPVAASTAIPASTPASTPGAKKRLRVEDDSDE